MCYYNRFLFFLLILSFYCTMLTGQGNCLVFDEDSGERLACELSHRASEYKQGSKESQLLFDHAIRLGPDYAWAYYQKSVPFFKRGMFAEGVSLINKAIELEPRNYLYYRAYWYFYNRSYEYAIKDLEALYVTHQSTYNTTPGGELEMRLILAMAYAQSGNVPKGIEWIKDLMGKYQNQPHLKGVFDHFCLGVLYYHNKQLNLAKAELDKQLEVDDKFADTYYYLGLIYEQLSDQNLANQNFREALSKMNRENGGYSMNIFEAFNVSIKDVEEKL